LHFGSEYFHKKKNQFVNKCLIPYINEVVIPNNAKIAYLQSDDDFNYKNSNVKGYLARFCTRQRISEPHHLIQNRNIERVIDTVINFSTTRMLNAILIDSYLRVG
jgi:spore cortex formation protein SpoVR/YcgB (stage V sporulation)